MCSRHTITLDNAAYEELKKYGKFGETYSELVMRLLSSKSESTNRSETPH